MTPRLLSTLRRARRLGSLALVMVLFAAGCASGSSPSSAASPKVAGNAAPAIGAPAMASTVPTTVEANGNASSGTTLAQGSSTGTAGSNAAAIYPYPGYPGSPGLAPDHTIVVTGSGQATMKSDLSDRATAERSAIAAALADAKAQADEVASVIGVSINGVLSVSVSSAQSYAVPMMVSTTVPLSAPGASPAIKLPVPVPTGPTSPQLAVSVTVEYRIG